MRFIFGTALLSAASVVAGAADAPPPKPSDVLKPPGAREIASPINDRFALRATYFPASVGTQMRLDNDNGLLGTDLSAEKDLGMRDKDDQGRIELTMRLLERNRIRFDYFKLTRNGDAVLSRTIDFGDQTFLISDRVQSLLDWRTLNFTYLYSPLRTSRFELGVGFGIHILDGEARARVPARQLREAKSGVVPFPTLAADATWRISRRFALSVKANYLSAGIDQSNGIIGQYHGDVQYRWKRNLALGLGYSALKTKVNIANGDFPGRFDFDVHGPELFFRASF